MGMSASQMRYCLLTGKKSDVEFQGQQINQQRTTLATETSSYNNQLLGLTVPTPPSSDGYSKTTYSFIGGSGEKCTITGLQYNGTDETTAGGTKSGRWTINYTTTGIGDEGKIFGMPTVMCTAGNNNTKNYSIGGNTLTSVDLTSLTSGGAVATPEDTADYSNLLKICQDCGVLKDNTTNPPTTITNPRADQVAGNFYKYVSDGVTKYVLASSITDIPVGGSEADYIYYVDTKATITKSDTLYNVKPHFAESGRMSSLDVYDAQENKIPYDLSVTNSKDDAAFNDAMHEYEYQKGLYDQQINNINAQICVIQSQDKKLELKLQDLDTQQEAITQEMESVKKVVDGNIKETFKAFG